MKITDVRTTLLTGPCTNDPYVLEIRQLRSAAFIGIEAALWDLKGKPEGKPVYELLGGRKHDALAAYATGGPSNFPLEKLVQKANHYQRHGFKAAKFGCGYFENGKRGGYTDPQQAADLEVSKLKEIGRASCRERV